MPGVSAGIMRRSVFGGEARTDHDVWRVVLRKVTVCHVLRNLGVAKGDKLFLLLGRTPALYVSMMGSFKNGTVVSPLFSAFGPEPIATRLRLGDASVLVTTAAQYRRKIAGIREQLPKLQHILSSVMTKAKRWIFLVRLITAN